ncbi:MAG TPA: beta-ketoacyl-ACP synthase [Burkholderiales bacterium]|nr:beta-ketoacyl-ACP synthase [Burkholderiales bacterium]
MPPLDPRPPRAISPLRVGACTLTWAGAQGRAATLAALRARRTGLRVNDFGSSPVSTYVGRVAGLDTTPLPQRFAEWDCRTNRLAWLALQQDDFIDAVTSARLHYGAERIAVVLGTFGSSIGASEQAYQHLELDGQFPVMLRRPIVHEPHSSADFVQHALGLRGVCVTVATACSSSAKAFAQAERIIHAGLADAAVVGGVDTLSGSALFGFDALGLLSREPCRPFDAERKGMSLGEGAGFALLESSAGPGPWLIGYGESSDAYHMCAPHPKGTGLHLVLREALARGRCRADQVDYVNLNGTASLDSDEVEARVIQEVFPERTLASSTKGWTGHTRGAAGAVESIISLLALDAQFVPGTLNTSKLDAACGPQIQIDNREAHLLFALNLSFGFGGSHCALLFGRERTPG